MDIKVNANDLSNEASIEISANKDDFMKFGYELIGIYDLLEISLKEKKSIYYQFSMDKIIFKVDDTRDTVIIKDRIIEFLSEKDTFFRLGMSIINVFRDTHNESCHFHIDKYDGFFKNMSCELIFSLDF